MILALTGPEEELEFRLGWSLCGAEPTKRSPVVAIPRVVPSATRGRCFHSHYTPRQAQRSTPHPRC
jgi:hypothetical protein